MRRPTMICPACDHVLTEMQLGKLKVDVCQGGCGGLWFDNFELPKADDAFATEAILQTRRNPHRRVDPARRRTCPHCEGVVMMRHFFSERRQTEVDTCPGCGGVWLDADELVAIRRELRQTRTREKAAQAYFRRLFLQDYMQTRAAP